MGWQGTPKISLPGEFKLRLHIDVGIILRLALKGAIRPRADTRADD